MEAKKRPSSKRQLLSDRTNTTATTRRNSSSSAAKPSVSAAVSISSATRNKAKHSAGNDSPRSHSTTSTCSDGSSPPDPPASSPSTSDSGSHLYALAEIQSQKPDGQTRIAKGQKDLVTPNVEDSSCETPRTTLMISSVSASGIHDHQRVKLSTVYDQRTVPRKRKHAALEIVLSLSCPHGKRMKKKGMRLDNYGDATQTGLHTDPLPVHKKKRSRRKHDVSPEEEIERLKAYYADIDAFELPEEEVTSERDLD